MATAKRETKKTKKTIEVEETVTVLTLNEREVEVLKAITRRNVSIPKMIGLDDDERRDIANILNDIWAAMITPLG